MRIHTLFICFLLNLFPLAVWAHGSEHSHDPVNQAQAEQMAIKTVAKLAGKGKIDSSWKSVNVVKTEQKKFGDHMEWVVSFKNDNINDASKQTLYIFLGITGNYIGANYTGK